MLLIIRHRAKSARQNLIKRWPRYTALLTKPGLSISSLRQQFLQPCASNTAVFKQNIDRIHKSASSFTEKTNRLHVCKYYFYIFTSYHLPLAVSTHAKKSRFTSTLLLSWPVLVGSNLLPARFPTVRGQKSSSISGQPGPSVTTNQLTQHILWKSVPEVCHLHFDSKHALCLKNSKHYRNLIYDKW